MIKSKYINVLIAILMTAAIVLTGVAVVYPGAFASFTAEGGSYSRFQYKTKLFDKNKIINIDIKVDENDFNTMLDNATQEEYISCDLVVNGTTYSSVGIRPKGNSSLNMVASSSDTDRFSFKFEFNHYIKGQTCFGLDKMVVNNMQGDATYMKEYLSYNMMSYIGVDTPLYAFAEIKVNGEPWGFYLAVEALEDSFAQRVYGSDYGMLYKPESMGNRGNGQMNDFINKSQDAADTKQDATMQSTNTNAKQSANANAKQSANANANVNAKQSTNANTIQSVYARTVKRMQNGGAFSFGGGGGTDLKYTGDDISNYSSIFNNAIFNATDDDYNRVIKALENLSNGTELEKYINVDEVLRYFAANTVLVNLDSYISNLQHNYYLYEEDGQLSILPWDFNLAFAGFQSNNASSAVNFPIDTPVSGVSLSERPIIAKLLEVPEYMEKYHKHLKNIVDNYFSSGIFDNTIEKLDTLISDYVKNDASAFYTYDEYKAALPMLVKFGQLRAESVKGQLDGKIPATTAAQSADSSKLIDASSINIQTMGTQGGGNGGKDGMQAFDGQRGNMLQMPGDVAGIGGAIPGANDLNADAMKSAMEIIQSANGSELTAEQIAKLKELGLTDEQINQITSMSKFTKDGAMIAPGGQNGNFDPMNGGVQAQSRQRRGQDGMQAAGGQIPSGQATDGQVPSQIPSGQATDGQVPSQVPSVQDGMQGFGTQNSNSTTDISNSNQTAGSINEGYLLEIGLSAAALIAGIIFVVVFKRRRYVK